jgi:hypothetical protein
MFSFKIISESIDKTKTQLLQNFEAIRKKLEVIPTHLKNQKSHFNGISTRWHSFSTYAESKLREFNKKKKPQTNMMSESVMHEGMQYFTDESVLREDNISAKDNQDKKFGEVIEMIFKDQDGNEFCKETAVRAHTMQLYREQLKAEKQYLQRLPNKTPEILARLIKINEELQRYQNSPATWGSTNTPRLLFKKYRDNAKEIEIPLLCNLRSHKVEFMANPENATATNRSAALSDFSHGETNLQELEDYLILLNAPSVQDEHFKEYHQKYNSYFKKYYNSNILYEKDVELLKKNIKARIEKAYGQPMDVEKIRQLATERRKYLERLMLQDLFLHLSESPPKSDTIFYGRTCMLDPMKPGKTEEVGFYNSERNQLLDMKALYDGLEGRKIFFTSTRAPFIDEKGNIHMPQTLSGGRKTAVMNTFLINTCVQGNKKNTGLQRAVNEDAVLKLDQLQLNATQQKLARELKNKLMHQKKTNFDLACEAIQFMHSVGYASADCYGGKDRTGYALALITYNLIKKHLFAPEGENKIPKLSKEDNILMAQIAHALIGPTGTARLIIQDNYGHRYCALKLVDFNLELYITGPGKYKLIGTGKRIEEYRKGAMNFLPQAIRPGPKRHHDFAVLYNEENLFEGTQAA